MNQHQITEIGESGTGMACDICGATGDAHGRKFINPSRLLEHMRVAHPESVSAPRFVPPPPIQPTQTYSLPQSAPLRAATPSAPPAPAGHPKFCPQCGFHLAPIQAAMKAPHPAPLADA